jgi:tetratricopeptide (TPR) repeat protein
VALARFEAAAKAAPTRAEIQYKLAATRTANGDLRGALAAWETTLRLDPQNESARDYALRLREKLGLLPAAIAPPDPARAGATATVDPAAAPAARAHSLGREFTRTGDPARLVEQAESLIANGRYPAAIRVLLEAVALHTGGANLYYQLASCHRRLGDVDQSAYFARLYLRVVSPSDPGAAARMRVAERWAQTPVR